jgi:hypothetical protein
MTKEEILKLIDKKINDAIEISQQKHEHNTDSWSSYYHGVAQGLKDSKSIIGMLNKPNNRS